MISLTGRSWVWRRSVIIGSLLVCASVVLKFTFLGGDNSRLNESLVNGAFLLAGMVIGSYVFGAVWDDKGSSSTVTSTVIKRDTPNGG